jgi:hypothetical protein
MPFYDKLPKLLVLLSLAVCSRAQDKVPIGVNEIKTDSLFLKGIYIENLDILIPWGTSFSEIKNYGNPKINNIKGEITVEWDSVKIISGVNASLYYFPKKVLTTKNYSKVFFMGGAVDSINAQLFKQNLEARFGTPNKTRVIKSKKMTEYIWYINKCYVSIRHWQDYPAIYKLHFQRIK